MATGWEASVRKQVEDIVKEKTIEFAKKAADELCKEYKYVMDDFYGEYDPKRYKRHKGNGGLYQNWRRFYKNSHGGLGVVYGGVEFGPEYMTANYNAKTGAFRVFDSFINGFHGPEFLGITSGIGDPYYHMIQFRDLLANNLT